MFYHTNCLLWVTSNKFERFGTVLFSFDRKTYSNILATYLSKMLK